MNLLDFLKLFDVKYILEIRYMYDNRRFLARNKGSKGIIGILPFEPDRELSYDGWNGEHFDEFAQERPYLNIDIRDCAAVNVDNERKKIQVFITEETPEL